ncbi:UNVERIFIED_CONTAM: hypothetical protein K2H54_040018 [Gekko kuhli]
MLLVHDFTNRAASMKISCGFLLLLLGSALPSPVPETKKTNDHLMYPYGAAAGDMKNPKNDDGTSPEIKIKTPFTFYGKEYHSLYVNNNGVISFGGPVAGYTPQPIPLTDGKHFVAPYWGDVNNVLGGDIWYREVKDPEELRRITTELNEYFHDIPFTAIWAFVATWDCVAYFGSVSKKTNTFQAILATDGQTSFIVMNYGDIQWTTGAASGGDRRTGTGGMPAQAGFNSGDDKNYFSIPGSRTPEIINITKTSNVNEPGRWAFQVDDFKVTGIPEELLHPPKEEEKANSNEEQRPQIDEPNGAEPSTTENLPQEEEPQVVQGNEVDSEVQGQEQMEEMEPVPSGDKNDGEEPQVVQGNEVESEVEGQGQKEEIEPAPSGDVREEEEPHDVQGNEVSSEVEGQGEKEEMEQVPSGDAHEEEEPLVNQDNEVNSEVEGQGQKEEMEQVPSEDVHEEEEPLVNQDNEVIPEAEGQEEEGMKPVPSGNQDETEESQGNQGYENLEEEGQQEKEIGDVDIPDRPVQEPQLVTETDDYSEEDCEW